MPSSDPYADAPPLVIAIDGPAGAGKSTVTKAVARALDILYLDTGAMYRAATVGVLESGVDPEDPDAVAAYVCERDIGFARPGDVMLPGEVVEERIRAPEITGKVYCVANNAACREYLVRQQQAIVAGRDAAVEGRDATTVICPDAPLKIYLDASPEERARRRLQEWTRAGNPPSFDEVVAGIRERDQRDTDREVGALRVAEDAVCVHTDRLEPEEVTARIIAHAARRRGDLLLRRLADQLQITRAAAGEHVAGGGARPGEACPWRIELSRSAERHLPEHLAALTRCAGSRRAVLVSAGHAVLVAAGRDDRPGDLLVLPLEPGCWYQIEAGCWHALIQDADTLCAWVGGEAPVEHGPLSGDHLVALRGYLAVLLPGH